MTGAGFRCRCVVGGGGLEPPRPRGRLILSQLRLPVTPSPQMRREPRAGSRQSRAAEYVRRTSTADSQLSTPASGGDDRIRTGDRGFADPCLATWPRRPIKAGYRGPRAHAQPDALTRQPSAPGPPVVPRRRFELLRPKGHHPLKMACLPIPPPRQASSPENRGRSGGTRTPDRRFWRPLLFQLSYAPRCARTLIIARSSQTGQGAQTRADAPGVR
jgi:hypothetical protein